MSDWKEAQPFAVRSADPAVLWRHYLGLGDAQLYVGQFELALDSALTCLQYADRQARHARQSRLARCKPWPPKRGK